MNILLIQPPIRDFYYTPLRSFPLGLCYLAAALEEQRHTVRILDCIHGARQRRIVRDDRFAYLDDFYVPGLQSPFGLFKNMKHYGLSYEEIETEIARSAADMVGISMLFSAYADEACTVARIVKKIYPAVPVIAGGHHATAYGQRLLAREPAIDIVVTGEGEAVFTRIANSWPRLEAVPGCVYRTGKSTVVSTATALPTALTERTPARHLLSLDDYQIAGKRYTPLFTTRGCPMQCRFCSVSGMFGSRLRVREPAAVVREIIDCYDRYGMRIFDLEDDNFTADRDYAEAVLRSLVAMRGGRTFELTAMNGLSYMHLDEELLGLLSAAGMRRLNISLVTAARETGRIFSRHVGKERFESVVRSAHEKGMQVTAYLILGMPGDTVAGMLESIWYLAALPVLIGPSVYYHVPGSSLFEELEKSGEARWDDYPFFRSSAFFYENKNFLRSDCVSLFYLVRMINFIKGLTQQETAILRTYEFDISGLAHTLGVRCDLHAAALLADRPLRMVEVGMFLICYMRQNGIFAHVRRLPNNRGQHRYIFVPCKISPDIFSSFCENFYSLFIMNRL